MTYIKFSVRILIISFWFFLPTFAASHGGGLDGRGGHNCYVGSCAGSYHYHGGGSYSSYTKVPVIFFFIVAAGLFFVVYDTIKKRHLKPKINESKFIDSHPPFNLKTNKFEWDGEWKQHYENGQLLSEGTFSDGTLIGPWREYYENGNLRHETNYDQENTPQLCSRYYENGNLKERGYVNDGAIGEWEYYYENGQLAKKCDINKENWNGLYVFYYEDGSIQFKGSFDNGFPYGVHKTFFENGQLEKEERFENYQSVYEKTFYEDGTVHLHMEIEEIDGKTFLKFYDQSGDLTDSTEL